MFDVPEEKDFFKALLEREKNASNQYFDLFSQCLVDLPFQEKLFLSATIKLSSANAFSFDKAKILSSSIGLITCADV